jgi:hypothetical protein
MNEKTAKKKNLFGIAKINGDSKLWFCAFPIPHWSSGSLGLPLFIWKGTWTKAFKLVRQIGGGMYPIEQEKP